MKKKIVFIGPLKSTFVKNDIEILSEKYEIVTFNAAIGRGLTGGLNLLSLYVKASFALLFGAAGVYGWFADYATFFPIFVAKILGKRSIVVAGGFDVGKNIQEHYGTIVTPFRWFFIKYSFLFSDLILSVSFYTERLLLELLPEVKSKNVMIYNCLGKDVLEVEPEIDKKNIDDIILTISQNDTYTEYLRKGIGTCIQVAKQLPHKQFVIASIRGEGLNTALKESEGLANVTVIPGPLNFHKEMVSLFKKASVYCQLSLEETFGVAAVESMYFGCSPVVLNNGSLGEVVHHTEYILPGDSTIQTIAKKVEEVSNYSIEKRKEISEWTSIYSYENRKKKLLEVVNF